MSDCKRCGNPVPPCSEACADVVAHVKRLERLAKGRPRLAKYREYPRGEA